MIFSLFRCFLPLPLISIPFEYLTMVGAERQYIFFESIQTMRCEYEFQMKQIPAEDISAILDDGLHLFVKLLLFLFLGISITAHSYIIHWFFNISYFCKLYLLALHYNRQLCCQCISICKPREFSLYWPSFKRLYFLSAYLSSMFADCYKLYSGCWMWLVNLHNSVVAYDSQDNTYNVVKYLELLERKRSSKSCSEHTVKVER